jgi:hypothetical protein
VLLALIMSKSLPDLKKSETPAILPLTKKKRVIEEREWTMKGNDLE